MASRSGMMKTIRQYWPQIRLGLYGLLWLLIWTFLYYFIVPSLLRDNKAVVLHASIELFGQTVGLYYLLGYYVFPRYLYTRRFLLLLLILTAIYLLVYISNYYEFAYLIQITNGLAKGASRSYVQRAWAEYLGAYSWLSCLTNFEVAFWNYAWSFFIVSVLLQFKIAKDVFVYQTRSLRLERDNLALELNYLRAQVNPHFLFNTLNSIYMRVIDVDEPAADLIVRLSDLMRYNLYDSNVDTIQLTHEIDYLRNYVVLERNRYSDRVSITFEADGSFDAYQIAPLLLISFVENAFKHGASKGRGEAYVRMTARMENDEFQFSVENSVTPAPKVAGQPGGVGLVNVRKRLAVLYPNRHRLTIRQEDHLFRVDLTIRLVPVSPAVRP